MSKPFLDRLDQTAAQLRGVAKQTALCWTVAAGVGMALLLVVIDWLGRFNDPGLRWLFTAALIGLTAFAARHAWQRFRPREATRLGVAQRLQAVRPDLGSRLASAVEFADSDAGDATAGSAQLRRAVVLDATHAADGLPFDAVVDRTPLKRASRYVVAAVAGVALLGIANASALGTGLYRLAAPWAHAPWPRTVTLRAVDAPTTLARGATFEATAVNESGMLPSDTRIEYRFASDGKTESAPAQLVGDQAIASREQVQRSFAYRFVGGDDDTMAWTELAVIDPPRAESFAVRIEPPAYSGLSLSESSGPLRVLAGSTLSLNGEADESLASAELNIADREEDLPLTVTEPSDGKQRFATETGGWIAETAKATYEVRLNATSGVVGVVGPHRYEVLADEPPKVEWRSAGDEAIVTSRAVVSIAGDASDDLAIQRVEVEWSLANADGETEAKRETIVDSGNEPPRRDTLGPTDDRLIDYDWDLEPLQLAEGTELTVSLVATDYLPQEGRPTTPRRLMVVSDEEYRSRLAERQSRLLGQVQQALETQRGANEATSDLDTDTRQAGEVSRRDLDRLTSIEFQQREAAAVVADPTTGAGTVAERLLADLRRSRLEAPELETQLSAAADALQRLADGALPAARSELASARRAGKRADAGEFGDRLADAGQQQAEAIDRLEQVADLLTSWADFQRFAAEAAALEQLERDLAAEAQRQAAAAAANAADRPSDADRDKLLTRQAEASRRFDKLRAAMQRLLNSQPDTSASSAAQSVDDALGEADDADVAGKLRDASRDLARGRLGAASRAQQAAAEGLRSMLDALRQRTPTDPDEIAERLAEEKQKLAELQQQVEELKRQPDTRQNRAARQQAAAKASRLGRRLDRLTAPQAGASTQQGAQQTGGQQQQGNQQQQLAQAQQSFEQAQRQIDERIDQLEEQQAEKLLDQLAGRIDGYIQRQSDVLDETLELDRLTDDPETARRVEPRAGDLADEQRDLTIELEGFAERLSKRAVFELALGGAAKQTAEAATRLDRALVGKRTQRVEATALARLKHIKEVLEQTPPPPPEGGQQGGGGGGQGGGQPPPPSPIDVAELKMLRLMQLEVLSETDAYEADTAAARRAGQRLPADWRETGRDLAARQSRLAELALELAERDNDPEAER
ncbi:MAG: hypothetical protein AAF266_12445 [Planctomycetota bacterium]